jgi:hypothetical protein
MGGRTAIGAYRLSLRCELKADNSARLDHGQRRRQLRMSVGRRQKSLDDY